jgi:hypothetical protein
MTYAMGTVIFKTVAVNDLSQKIQQTLQYGIEYRRGIYHIDNCYLASSHKLQPGSKSHLFIEKQDFATIYICSLLSIVVIPPRKFTDEEDFFFFYNATESKYSVDGFHIILRRNIVPSVLNVFLPSISIVLASFIGYMGQNYQYLKYIIEHIHVVSFWIPSTAVPGRISLLVTAYLVLTNMAAAAQSFQVYIYECHRQWSCAIRPFIFTYFTISLVAVPSIEF